MTDESHIVANCHECVLGIRGQVREGTCLEKEKEYSEVKTIFVVLWLEHLQRVEVQILAPNCTSLSSIMTTRW
jgi:hypothetical protein